MNGFGGELFRRQSPFGQQDWWGQRPGYQEWYKPWYQEAGYGTQYPTGQFQVGYPYQREPEPGVAEAAWMGEQQQRFKALSYQRAMEALERDKPRFETIPTLTPQQQQILSQLRGMGAPQPTPVTVGAAGQFAPTPTPGAARPTYGAMPLAGAGERQAALSRMMGVSPEEEAAAIGAMTAPAMRQFEEEILPGVRGAAVGTGTAWSRSRAREEARAGGALAERLAGMGEQFRMERRGQAMQAAGLGAQEALGAAQAGLTRYGTEMQPYMQAQQAQTQAALQAQQLGAQAGMQTQMAQLQAALQGQQLGMQGQMGYQQLLAQLLGTPMMAYYSY